MIDFKKLRTDEGYYSKWVAKQVGITPAYLSNIENGKFKPSLQIVQRLCDLYKVDWKDYYDD